MIRYRLGCPEQHEFESWFRSGSDFDALARDQRVSCPVCGSNAIEKLPMAPAVISGVGRTAKRGPSSVPTSQAEPGRDEIIKQIRAFKQKVVANSEDVGPRFAEEARKIHYGEAEERNIVGASTADEACGLAEDGIPFGVLPPFPEDHN